MRHIILSETNLLIQKFCTVVTDSGSLMCNTKVCAQGCSHTNLNILQTFLPMPVHYTHLSPRGLKLGSNKQALQTKQSAFLQHQSNFISFFGLERLYMSAHQSCCERCQLHPSSHTLILNTSQLVMQIYSSIHPVQC